MGWREGRWFYLAAFLTLLPGSTTASAEEACIKYHKCIPLDKFDCKEETRSSLIHKHCYFASQQYLVMSLGKNKTFYHWCNVPADIVANLRSAPSMGRYFNENIVGTATGGKYDCRNRPVPQF